MFSWNWTVYCRLLHPFMSIWTWLLIQGSLPAPPVLLEKPLFPRGINYLLTFVWTLRLFSLSITSGLSFNTFTFRSFPNLSQSVSLSLQPSSPLYVTLILCVLVLPSFCRSRSCSTSPLPWRLSPCLCFVWWLLFITPACLCLSVGVSYCAPHLTFTHSRWLMTPGLVRLPNFSTCSAPRDRLQPTCGNLRR